MTHARSAFDGMDEIVAAFLGLRDGETLKHKGICRRLETAPKNELDFDTLVAGLYARIAENRSDHEPSPQNWRVARQTILSDANLSPEVLLERAIAILGERGVLADWFNQIPVASGLVDEFADKRAAIDLMRHQKTHTEFFELKWASDTPAYAAFEILRYGLAYLYSLVHRKTLGYQQSQLMGGGSVALSVLAPRAYYTGYDLTWLGRGLDRSIRRFSEGKTEGTVTMNFGFLAFPRGFDLPFTTGEEVRRMQTAPTDSHICQAVVSAVCGLEPVWSSPGGEPR